MTRRRKLLRNCTADVSRADYADLHVASFQMIMIEFTAGVRIDAASSGRSSPAPSGLRLGRLLRCKTAANRYMETVSICSRSNTESISDVQG
jgi:hypothetical protein